MNKTWMVIDVESVGLHGEAFAVGIVIIQNGFTTYEACYACPSVEAVGVPEDRLWVEKNCLGIVVNCSNPKEVRDKFWKDWLNWKAQGAFLVADCAWPVEGRFLARCVMDDHCARNWLGPYPLHDVASMMMALGKDPLAKYPRLPNEVPEHNPLNDARQSARLLMEIQQISESKNRNQGCEK